MSTPTLTRRVLLTLGAVLLLGGAAWWSVVTPSPLGTEPPRLKAVLDRVDIEIASVEGVDAQLVRDAAWAGTLSAGKTPHWRDKDAASAWLRLRVAVKPYPGGVSMVLVTASATTYATPLGGTKVIQMDGGQVVGAEVARDADAPEVVRRLVTTACAAAAGNSVIEADPPRDPKP